MKSRGEPGYEAMQVLGSSRLQVRMAWTYPTVGYVQVLQCFGKWWKIQAGLCAPGQVLFPGRMSNATAFVLQSTQKFLPQNLTLFCYSYSISYLHQMSSLADCFPHLWSLQT